MLVTGTSCSTTKLYVADIVGSACDVIVTVAVPVATHVSVTYPTLHSDGSGS